MPHKREIDWRGIEGDYRAGIRPLRDIAEQYGVTHSAIRKRATRDGWERNLTARIQVQAEAAVSKLAVSKMVSNVTEAATIAANAELMASRVLQHRRSLSRLWGIGEALMVELEGVTAQAEDYIRLAQIEGDDAKLREALEKAASLPGRILQYKTLAEATAKIVPLDRQAFGLRDEIEQPADNAGQAAAIGAVVAMTMDKLRERMHGRVIDARG